MDLGKPIVAVGDAFPTTPYVQREWKVHYTIGDLIKGYSKVLIVSLPGAFTPT